ncbi:MAG: 4,5-DOPA dioxygenase extradiol [Bacteroidetes bacterium GWD2_45_23]|nr:MAG: 4,5-DOPA dioxygenase extradiol [Bacteroidetes bacterium GWC2_46_850]OFX72150.1 MAG: 4,5-DOPA dioxygenase extradiol [Bacteroidetes bacterium GWC1_47_7]OFX84687.1 MAG: 4,5-DOPA dioxygenase extradiol [Bacteroidetes bacterium GWD2_45_23]HAR38943.1 4,5-DOPA dioxygenase extradiol [Porphyromonadaceae bacterium]HBB00596.1 4,5-DOPA dioxygenase extradiol [Porphyromonadaceae bacterium]
MKLSHLRNIASHFGRTDRMPVLFLGHGSPMNAIEENMFVASFRELGHSLPKPQLILCVSAHWETKGTFVTAMSSPETIHDFGGFPRELYEVQYPAPGSPEWASKAKKIITKTEVELDYNWGLDHGAWSVIKHLYPQADVPVIQMSIDYTKPSQYHYDLAKEIGELSRKGVLIVGSGNMVHNLRLADFRRLSGDPYGYDWAIEANELMKSYILDDDHQSLIQYRKQGAAFDLAIPTPEHYLPLIYALALKEKNDEITLFNDEPVGGSLTMTSVLITP